MKSLRALKAAGLVLAAVVLGLMTVQGSYALWNAAASVKAGTVQAANFRMLVNEVEMTGPEQTVYLPGISAIKPGESTYATALVMNGANASSNMRVQPSVSVQPATNGFANFVTVQVARIGDGQTCGANTFVPTSNLGVIGQGSTATICFKVTLATGTDPALLGNPLTVPVTLTVTQMKP